MGAKTTERGPRPYDPAKQLMAQSLMLEMDIPIKEGADSPCVFFLYYGPKYVIIKSKTLQLAVDLFKKGYAYYIGYEHKPGKQMPSIYQRIYEYMRKHPGQKFTIGTPIFSTPYPLLKLEQIALWANLKDNNCMNANIDAYIPRWNPKTKLYGGWIPKTAVMNFRKFVKRHHSTASRPQ